MNEPRPARVLDGLFYDVLQAAVMLLFLLSSASTNRRKHQVTPGVAHPIPLPGLSLCLLPAIILVPDDALYGPNGAAAQMAYTGWITETYALWENRNRNELQASFSADDAIRPEMDAFGDLRHIRNDLLHNNGIASEEQMRKCVVLKWFRPDERMVLGTRHVLDFLNQTGVLSLHSATTRSAIRACSRCSRTEMLSYSGGRSPSWFRCAPTAQTIRRRTCTRP